MPEGSARPGRPTAATRTKSRPSSNGGNSRENGNSAVPRRPATVTQADFARAIRAAKEAGGNAATIDGEGVARAEVAAYADGTESQMMAMFGWTDPKMPAHYIAQANREKLGISGMGKIVAFDQSQSLDDLLQLPEANRVRTFNGNELVTFPGNIR